MNIEKLPSGSYRIRQMYKGKKYSFTLPYKPTQKEITILLAEKLQNQNNVAGGSFEYYANQYINNRENILSPASFVTYKRLLNVIPDDFKQTNIYDITTEMIQNVTNEYSAKHAPKTTRNLHGFISSILGQIRPDLHLTTTLPKVVSKSRYKPTEEDIKRILEYTKGTMDSIPIQLGILSLRKSEICALTLDDLHGNELTVNKDLVYDGKKYRVKYSAKTEAGNRTVYLPDSLVKEINEAGTIFDLYPNKLLEHLHKIQKELDIPQFRFHDLRSYFASYASTLNLPESDIMAIGGWKSDYVFKRIYRESLEASRINTAKEIAEKII